MTRIEDYIPVGQENAITRRELAQRTGFPDRVNRSMIEAARLCGVRIVSSSGRPGYYIAESDDDMGWREFLEEQRRRGQAALDMWNRWHRSPDGRYVHVREHMRRIGPVECPEQIGLEDV